MGLESKVWMAAVRAATDRTLDDLTGAGHYLHTPFNINYHLSYKALSQALNADRVDVESALELAERTDG